MCYYVKVESKPEELEKEYGAEFIGEAYHQNFKLNGFAHPRLPVVLDYDTSHILTAEWGLIPSWARDKEIQKKTLNARIETAAELNSYKNAVSQRCLVLVNGFHEWKWLDEKGKQKDHYLIGIQDQPIFALGGLYNSWTNPQTGEETTTVTLVTTEANELMASIHNTKRRMPILLNRMVQYRWLDDAPLQDFAFPHYEAALTAQNLTNLESQISLF